MLRLLDPEDAAKFKRKTYRFGPSCLLNEEETNMSIPIEKLRLCILGGLIQAMQNQRITHHRFPLYFCQENEIKKIYAYGNKQANNFPCLKNHTYFLLPYEAIYIAVSLGIFLPIELQIASNIYQIQILTSQSLSKRQRNEVKRDAVSQAYWWSFPNENISTICRKIDRLKTQTDFDFLHSSNYERKKDTNMRPRASIQKMKPDVSSEIKWIPEVIQKNECTVYIDFQRLKLVFHVMLKMMLIKKPLLQLEEFLVHPLISLYSCVDNQAQKLVSLCARDTLNDLGFC